MVLIDMYVHIPSEFKSIEFRQGKVKYFLIGFFSCWFKQDVGKGLEATKVCTLN